MLTPEVVTINSLSGAIAPETGRYVKTLAEIRGVFQDEAACDAALAKNPDIVVYEVIEYKKDGSDLFFGTTTMKPGKVGDEFFMTRGHFHKRDDMGEVYYTQSGEGVLLLEARNGETATLEMRPGGCTFIPPGWAHRSINTGPTDLIFVWVCNIEAGNDYAEILVRGMRKIVVDQAGRPTVLDNPNRG